MADYRRQDDFKDFLRCEPLRSRLLDYAEKHGITGDTFGGEDREMFQLMEAFDRAFADKILRSLGESFVNYPLEKRLDGCFTTGGTMHNLEIKARFYDLNDVTRQWAWCVDEEKYREMLDGDAWLLYLWVSSGNPLEVQWALWDVSKTEPSDVPIRCRKSVAKSGSGVKNKAQKGWFIRDAEHTGKAVGRIS